MFKKEYFFVFALIGLSIVYAFLSLIVFFSRGKWGRAFNKKLAVGAMIIAFCAIINSQNIAYSQAEDTPGPTPVYGTLEPIATPEPTEMIPVPTYAVPVIMVPSSQTVRTNEDFTTDININSGNQKIAAYGITATYDTSFISVDVAKGTSGVAKGHDGFIAAVNSTNPGEVAVTGFDMSGTGPGSNLNFLKFYWTAGDSAGSTEISFIVNKLVDPNTNPISGWFSSNNSVNVQIIELILGDVNSDKEVDIVDALLVAQYYVDMNPQNFNPDAADVDASGDIDIVDALLISQKFVGLIDTFPGE